MTFFTRKAFTNKNNKDSPDLWDVALSHCCLVVLLLNLLHQPHPHWYDIISVALVTAASWPYRKSIMSRSIIPSPADWTLPSGVRSFPILHMPISYNPNIALTFLTVLSLTSASFAVWRIGYPFLRSLMTSLYASS